MDRRWIAAFILVAATLQACAPSNEQPPRGASAELLALHAAASTPEGQYRLGQAYALDIVTPYDEERSLYWFRQAAQAGYAPAQYEMGGHFALSGMMEDDGQAAAWFRAAAEQGYPPAQAALGMRYAEGHLSGSPDPLEAYVRLRLAADGGEEVESLLHRLVEQLSAEDRALAQRIHRQREREY